MDKKKKTDARNGKKNLELGGHGQKIPQSVLVQSLTAKVENLTSQLQATQACIDSEVERGPARIHVCVAEGVGVVGLKEALTHSHLSLKIIWVVLVLAGAVATTYYIYQNTSEYLNREPATKISVERSIAYDFPPLVICPPFWLNYNKTIQGGLDRNALQYSLGYGHLSDIYLDSAFDLMPTNPDTSGVQLAIDDMIKARHSFLDYYTAKNFSSLIDYYTAIACNVTGNTDDDDDSTMKTMSCTGCNDSRPPEKIIFSNAICYQFHFNQASPRSATEPTEIQLSSDDNTNGLFTAKKKNWRLDVLPNIPPGGPTISLEPYNSYTIKLSAQRVIRLINASNCVDTTTNQNYDQRVCTEKCLSQLESQKPDFTGYTSFVVTNNVTEVINQADVVKDIIVGLNALGNDTSPDANNTVTPTQTNGNSNTNNTRSKGPSNQALFDCFQTCLPPCDRVTYDMTFDRTVGDIDKANRSIIDVTIKHSAVSQGGIVVWQEVTTMSFSDFVANVGGTLGLFLGCTILTFAQVVLSFIGYCLDYKAAKKGKYGPPTAVVVGRSH